MAEQATVEERGLQLAAAPGEVALHPDPGRRPRHGRAPAGPEHHRRAGRGGPEALGEGELVARLPGERGLDEVERRPVLRGDGGGGLLDHAQGAGAAAALGTRPAAGPPLEPRPKSRRMRGAAALKRASPSVRGWSKGSVMVTPPIPASMP